MAIFLNFVYLGHRVYNILANKDSLNLVVFLHAENNPFSTLLIFT